jgi:hypothetical protein
MQNIFNNNTVKIYLAYCTVTVRLSTREIDVCKEIIEYYILKIDFKSVIKMLNEK